MKLKDIVTDYKISVDTCSLRTNGARIFFSNLENELLKTKKKLLLHQEVINELKKYISNQEVKKAERILKEYKNKELLDLKKIANYSFADNIFIEIFTKFRNKYNLCLITQDKNLAQDILALNSSNSVKGIKKIIILGIKKNGEYEILSNNLKKKKIIIKKGFCFKKGTKVIKNNSKIDIDKLPIESDIIRNGNAKKIQLKECIGSGGEGKIYKTDTNMVCKIYKKDKLIKETEDKLKLMMSGKLNCSGITFPKELVYSNDKFVGYLMNKAEGDILQSILIKPILFEKFPEWKKLDLVKLSLKILKKIEYLHSKNIIIGDINLQNILLDKNQEVYFVDTDSYQIENYPCKVGTILFTPPELQGKSYKEFLRTKKHENFAIATLLFMVLLPGKHPYSQQGGSTPKENIKKGNFSYPLGKNSNRKTPNGPWRFIWSHLSYSLKEAFFETFKNGKRYNVSDWIEILSQYKYSIESNFVSNEMFPKETKKLTEHAKQRYNKEFN